MMYIPRIQVTEGYVHSMRIAVDIGGTFTDVALFDEAQGTVTPGKALSTPANLVDGIMSAMVRTTDSPAAIDLMIHGSTVVINSIIERQGAKTALITTKGFRDVYEIGRINRPESFNLFFRKHRPLIPRDMIFEVPERMLADGTEEQPSTRRLPLPPPGTSRAWAWKQWPSSFCTPIASRVTRYRCGKS